MPFPSTLARINRRVTNPVVRRFAGRVAPLAIVIHRGRRSGKEYRTPVMTFRKDGTFIVALTYGRGTDWERNVLSAGGCELIYRDQKITLTAPAIVSETEASPFLPRVLRRGLRMTGVGNYLRLARA